MSLSSKAGAANWLTACAIVIAIALSLLRLTTEYGWLGMAFGQLAYLFWTLVVAWVVCVTCVLRWQRRWWLLTTAPVVLYPVFMSFALLGACASGDCL